MAYGSGAFQIERAARAGGASREHGERSGHHLDVDGQGSDALAVGVGDDVVGLDADATRLRELDRGMVDVLAREHAGEHREQPDPGQRMHDEHVEDAVRHVASSRMRAIVYRLGPRGRTIRLARSLTTASNPAESTHANHVLSSPWCASPRSITWGGRRRASTSASIAAS